jgi:cytochrome d ubiquinol oxidase subunit II
VIVAVVAGGIVLFPALALLFRLVLGGRLGHGAPADEHTARAAVRQSRPRLALRVAIALAVAGVALTNVADSPWAHGFGVCALLGFVIAGVWAVRPADLAAHPTRVRQSRP